MLDKIDLRNSLDARQTANEPSFEPDPDITNLKYFH